MTDKPSTEVAKALRQLIDWKDYKANLGKDAIYERGKEEAWTAARQALAAYDASPPSPVPVEREPGLGWEMSPETKAAIAAIDENIAYAARHASSILCGSASPPSPVEQTLAELDALHAKATNGEWSVRAGVYDTSPQANEFPHGPDIVCNDQDIAAFTLFGEGNATFTAAAFNAYPALHSAISTLAREAADAAAEIARLKAEFEEADDEGSKLGLILFTLSDTRTKTDWPPEVREIIDALIKEIWPDGTRGNFDLGRELAKARAERDTLAADAARMREALDFVETWVCNPVSSYSVSALDGLFGMTRDRIAALNQETPDAKAP